MKIVKQRHKTSTRRRSYWLVARSLALPALVATIWYALAEPSSRPPEKALRTIDTVTQSPNATAALTNTDTITNATDRIPYANAKDAATTTPDSEQTREIPFTVDEVYVLVQTVNLDETGNLALGNDTLLALDRLFLNGDKKLSEQDLRNLRELIEAGLPGETGGKAAGVATDYYDYLEAQTQLTATHRPEEGSASGLSGEQLYRELRQLRAMHLGQDVADQLFRTADAQFTYMTQARDLQTDNNLSQEQKLAEVHKLGEALQEASIGISNWPQRRNQFLTEKRRIVEAALAESAKQDQIQTLLKRNFRPDELEQIKHLKLDNL